MNIDEPESPSGRLVRFYRGEAPDSSGRRLSEIRAWDYGRLESVHDYIQWLFPTRKKSGFNREAPLLDDDQIREFRRDARLQEELLASLRQMLAFYGLLLEDHEGQISIGKSSEWETRSGNWLNPHNHNYLRITRILDCLRILGFRRHGRALLTQLESIFQEYPDKIAPETKEFWKSAAG
jgi:hypothetical protein